MKMGNSKLCNKPGRLYGVGVGPGDPELITLKAQRVLSQVSVVFIPKSNPGEESYAFSIVKELLDKGKTEIQFLAFPMIRDEDRLKAAWNLAVNQMWQKLSQGKDCAFITEGDPLLYSTFIYIYEIFQGKYPEVAIEIIPGISSIFAAAARAQVPLARGDGNLAILSASSKAGEIKEILESFDTVIFTKIDRSFDSLLMVLEELNLVNKALWIKRCTTREEEIVRDIRQLKGRKLDYLSLLIVGRIKNTEYSRQNSEYRR